MQVSIWVVVFVVVVLVGVLWAYYTAQRLNRLHIRTDAARQALQAALNRRAAVAAAVNPELRQLSRNAESIPLHYEYFPQRAKAERELVGALGELGETSIELVEASTRVELASRFYNDAVADTRALRLRLAVRALCLRGTAALPDYFDYSARLPEVEEGRGPSTSTGYKS